MVYGLSNFHSVFRKTPAPGDEHGGALAAANIHGRSTSSDHFNLHHRFLWIRLITEQTSGVGEVFVRLKGKKQFGFLENQVSVYIQCILEVQQIFFQCKSNSSIISLLALPLKVCESIGSRVHYITHRQALCLHTT